MFADRPHSPLSSQSTLPSLNTTCSARSAPTTELLHSIMVTHGADCWPRPRESDHTSTRSASPRQQACFWLLRKPSAM